MQQPVQMYCEFRSPIYLILNLRAYNEHLALITWFSMSINKTFQNKNDLLSLSNITITNI